MILQGTSWIATERLQLRRRVGLDPCRGPILNARGVGYFVFQPFLQHDGSGVLLCLHLLSYKLQVLKQWPELRCLQCSDEMLNPVQLGAATAEEVAMWLTALENAQDDVSLFILGFSKLVHSRSQMSSSCHTLQASSERASALSVHISFSTPVTSSVTRLQQPPIVPCTAF
jgi:hypothetical protein